jgi:hypothetical protein
MFLCFALYIFYKGDIMFTWNRGGISYTGVAKKVGIVSGLTADGKLNPLEINFRETQFAINKAEEKTSEGGQEVFLRGTVADAMEFLGPDKVGMINKWLISYFEELQRRREEAYQLSLIPVETAPE